MFVLRPREGASFAPPLASCPSPALFLGLLPLQSRDASLRLWRADKEPMKPQEVTIPAHQPTQSGLHCPHSVPSVSQHPWQGPRSGEDAGSAWTPEFLGAVSSAACWDNRHCYGNNHRSNKFQGVQKRSSHSGQQLWGGPASGQKAPRGPITWEVTHREARHSVAIQHMLGGESTPLHAPRLWPSLKDGVYSI